MKSVAYTEPDLLATINLKNGLCQVQKFKSLPLFISHGYLNIVFSWILRLYSMGLTRQILWCKQIQQESAASPLILNSILYFFSSCIMNF